MNFSNWQSMLFSAQGRIRRSQYWLWAIIVGVAFGILFQILSMLTMGNAAQTGQVPAAFWIGMAVLYIPMLYISVCLQIKRWHDRDKSGWWCFIALVPVIGGIWALIECGFLDGTQGPNKYGPSPKGLG